MPSPLPSFAGAEGSILLVEDYDALAAAITAALRKFAPRHAVRVVPSLALAAETALAAPPDLLILDFDPPLPGALEFLEALRDASAETRAIVIAADLPRQFLSERDPNSGLTFIEKPFQLEELGACIQSLLPPRNKTTSADASPTLHDLNLADVIPLFGLGGSTEVVRVTDPEREMSGEVHFARGQIQHAVASELSGIDALREMLRWTSPDFARAESDEAAPRSIEGRWTKVLGQVQRSMVRPSPPRESAGPRTRQKKARLAPTQPAPRDGKKVLVIDDTEALREFVEEMLSIADPRLQIASAVNGAEGVKQSFSFRPDLILLDYSLPDFNGDEVCRRLLADEKLSQIPVIMMSGHVAEMAQTAARYENVVMTLSKPFVSAALVEAVAKTLTNPPKRGRIARREIDENGRKPNGQSPLPSSEAPKPAPPPLTPAHIPVASSNSVVLSLPMEVAEMTFSSRLQLSTLRARPSSQPVLLYVDPQAVSAVRLPEVAFAVDHVGLDVRGQIQTVRIVPVAGPVATLPPHTAMPVDHLTIAAEHLESSIQITPAPEAHMTIRLLASFDLAGVQLSPTFGVANFALSARNARMRAVLPGPGSKAGIALETFEVRLDSRSRIALIALRAING